ncbi:unnamed protein product [Mycena citricolor]|uniref:Uncharacterized protein n=1 Tax=Mycena citricolor TaxID=2018698 RepID=A0AAD2Q4F2_9AGAR|nr:unnamed protein product [Mycena citricolor]
MKVLTVLALAASATAQYFSEGWRPGQAVTAEGAAPTFIRGPPGGPGTVPKKPAEPFKLTDLLDMNKLAQTELVQNLFDKVGVNISERMELVNKLPWDPRIPLITDANYVDMIVNEPLTPEEEEDRLWIILVYEAHALAYLQSKLTLHSSAATNRQEGLSKFFDEAFDTAYNDTLLAGDLPHVRFARIDYLNVTYVTTKWNLWVAPSIVVLKDRGQTLRFYRSNQLRVAQGALREFLKQDGWMLTTPWSSAFAPGGSREFVLEYFAKSLTTVYLWTIKVPKFVLIILSGSMASFFINIFHGWGGTNKPQAKSQPTPQAIPATTTPAAAAPSTAVAPAPASPSKAKQRKGKGKK